MGVPRMGAACHSYLSDRDVQRLGKERELSSTTASRQRQLWEIVLPAAALHITKIYTSYSSNGKGAAESVSTMVPSGGAGRADQNLLRASLGA